MKEQTPMENGIRLFIKSYFFVGFFSRILGGVFLTKKIIPPAVV